MKEFQKNSVESRRLFVFTLITGLIVGFLSVISDNLPNLSDGITLLEYVISYLAVMINSLPVWFILAMLVGYIFAGNIKKAVLFGAMYTLTAITFYFLIGYFYVVVPVTISFKEQAIAYAIWYGASAVGGILGGIVGFFIKKTPYALLFLLVGLILQLAVNGSRSWSNIIGISQNVTCCLMIMCIIMYLLIVRLKTQIEPNKDQ